MNRIGAKTRRSRNVMTVQLNVSYSKLTLKASRCVPLSDKDSKLPAFFYSGYKWSCLLIQPIKTIETRKEEKIIERIIKVVWMVQKAQKQKGILCGEICCVWSPHTRVCSVLFYRPYILNHFCINVLFLSLHVSCQWKMSEHECCIFIPVYTL